MITLVSSIVTPLASFVGIYGLSRVKIPSLELFIYIAAAILALVALIAIASVVKEVFRVKKVIDAEKAAAANEAQPQPEMQGNPYITN